MRKRSLRSFFSGFSPLRDCPQLIVRKESAILRNEPATQGTSPAEYFQIKWGTRHFWAKLTLNDWNRVGWCISKKCLGTNPNCPHMVRRAWGYNVGDFCGLRNGVTDPLLSGLSGVPQCLGRPPPPQGVIWTMLEFGTKWLTYRNSKFYYCRPPAAACVVRVAV